MLLPTYIMVCVCLQMVQNMVAPVEGPAAAGRGVLEFCNPDIKSAIIDIKENYSQLAETIQVQSLEHTHNVHVTKTEHTYSSM